MDATPPLSEGANGSQAKDGESVPGSRWCRNEMRKDRRKAGGLRESHQSCLGDRECEGCAGHAMGSWIRGQELSRAEVEIWEISAEVTNEGTGVTSTQRE